MKSPTNNFTDKKRKNSVSSPKRELEPNSGKIISKDKPQQKPGKFLSTKVTKIDLNGNTASFKSARGANSSKLLKTPQKSTSSIKKLINDSQTKPI